MFKKTALALAAVVSFASTALADSQDTAISALKAEDVKFTVEGDKIYTEWENDCVIIIKANDENKTFNVGGYARTAVPQEKRDKALRILNEMNCKYRLKYYLDEDGDVFVQNAMDFDDMVLSEKAVITTLYLVAKALQEAREEMMKVRYGS